MKVTAAIEEVLTQFVGFHHDDEWMYGEAEERRLQQESSGGGTTIGGIIGPLIIIGIILYCCRGNISSCFPSEEEKLDKERRKIEARADVEAAKNRLENTKMETEISQFKRANNAAVAQNLAQGRLYQAQANTTAAEARVHASTQVANSMALGVVQNVGTAATVEPMEIISPADHKAKIVVEER
ncbi:unnamed protein product [Cylindrotheca closterium]|uniref:Uncharacterized protein n=1 Tax=Cylindrotheca closterium TaxID=2856 RepID=A0AAD2G6M4_9STRA|nr:unnamed protein product [Cylindrotheca closterium]